MRTVSDYDFDRNGLIGADGTTTKWFDYAKAMNAQIAAVDDVLMAATLEGYVIGTIGEAKWRELTDGGTGDSEIEIPFPGQF